MYQDVNEIDNQELTNDIVTVSKLQVGLRIKADQIQEGLAHLVEQVASNNLDELFILLQQVANLLLEYSTFWSHVLANSQTVGSRKVAENLFNQLSLQERTKLTKDALVHAMQGGKKEGGAASNNSNDCYVVVTLILGTADDQPIFDEIYSGSLLKDTLQDIAMIRSRYLMAFDLIWNPQLSTDKLTETDMTTDYGDMVEIA
jgi:uncharacterized membrane protein